MPDKSITVSDRFFSIFENFTIKDVSHEMRLLSKKELYLLLVSVTDCDVDYSGEFVLHHNFVPFKNELLIISDVSKGKSGIDDEDLAIINSYKDRTMSCKTIKNANGNTLKMPPSEEEAVSIRRDLAINEIIK
jgi:hypothetical protein